MCEPGFHGRDVVELRRARGPVKRNRCAYVAGAIQGAAVGAEHRKGLVDGSVVAVRERHDLRAARDRASQAKRPSVGVGGGEAERPQR